jgi:adenylosuccinate synthase
MILGKFNVVTDGQWGSCGKGLISTALADRHRPEMISTTNMANAGHTAINENGEAFIAKAVPSPAILKKWRHEYYPAIFLGASCAFHLDRLLEEIKICEIEDCVFIHERAGVITDAHREAETSLTTGTKHVASTMQGCGAFLSDKVMRRKELKLARDYPELSGYMATSIPERIKSEILKGKAVAVILRRLMQSLGWTILHEGSQGFSLDISHGSHYPQCTSRSTTAIQNLADMGLPAQSLGDVYLVIRPYPIRVGNVIEGGEQVGYSGDCYPGQEEMTWEQVAKAAGAPPEVTKGELTTVTKRLRRVFSFSEAQLEEAVTVNGATKLALNFANYVDWACYGMNQYDDLPQKVKDFIRKCEDIAQIPVTMVGTGPNNNHVCFVE